MAGEVSPSPAPLPDRMATARYGVTRLLDERGELRRFEVLEEEVIRFAVDHYRGHMSEVARRLGIGRSTLYQEVAGLRDRVGRGCGALRKAGPNGPGARETKGWGMRLLPSAVVLAAVAMLVVPAHAIETSPAAAPADAAAVATTAPEAPPLSPQAAAIQGALEQAGHDANARERAILEGVSSFYAARNFEPLWIRDGRAGGQMSALRRRMDAAAMRGLDPAAYATPEFAQTYPDDAQIVAAAEVDFSRAAVRFVTHLAAGRIRPSEISSIITLEPVAAGSRRDPDAALRRRLDGACAERLRAAACAISRAAGQARRAAGERGRPGAGGRAGGRAAEARQP